MKEEAVKLLGLNNEKFDYAIPEKFFDDIIGANPGATNILGNFIWIYDHNQPVHGRPRPLTVYGQRLLGNYNKLWGTEYPIDMDVISG